MTIERTLQLEESEHRKTDVTKQIISYQTKLLTCFMGRKYAIRDQLSIHSVTFTIVNWIDVFIRDPYKEVIISSLQYCQEKKNTDVTTKNRFRKKIWD